MIDPRQITPLLSNTTVDSKIAKGPSGEVYLVTRRTDNKKMALKHLSIPSSESQTKALIYSGAVKNEAQAQRYYSAQVQELKSELLLLNNVKNADNLLKFRGYQVDQKFIGSGYDVYILSDYCDNLPDAMKKKPLTKLEALNLAIDLCSALEQLRAAGLIHKDVHPRNIFRGSNGHFMIGDLGAAQISELQYSALPDAMITEYTAPELLDGNATLNETMDIYSIGVVLYEVYNGELPRNSKGKFVRKEDKPLAEPEYADVALSEIILKACAYAPEARYQSPSDMKQALMLCLQRGDVTDEYLLPQPEPVAEPEVEEEAPPVTVVDANAIAAAVAAAEAEVQPIELGENEVLSADVQPEPEAAPARSLNDLGEDELMLPTSGEITVEEFMASLRKNTGIEVFSMDSEGNMSTVPGYETEETLPEDTEYVTSADNHLEILQTLDELELPTEPETAPSSSETADEISAALQDIVAADMPLEDVVPVDVDAVEEPEAIYVESDGEYDAEDEDYDDESDEDEDDEEEEVYVSRRDRRKQRRQARRQPVEDEEDEDDFEYDNGYEDDDEYDDDDYEEKGSAWKKVLITIIVLLVLAGGTFALYTFKTDTINSMNSQVNSSTSITVVSSSKNESAMEVICSTAAGEVARVPYTENGATFTDLNPNTTYTFTMASADGKFLLGSKTIEAKTKEMTNLTGFAASSLSAVSATLALSGTGPVPDTWIVTLTSSTGENITVESADIPVVVEGLTPETTYTATISRGDGDLLGGTTECSFTTMEYTNLATFETTDIATDKVSLVWSYAGTVPDAWDVTCEGTDGTVTTQAVNGTECTLDGLTSGETYTISLSCPSLKATELSTITVAIPSVTITGISGTANEDGDIEVSWEYTSDIEPEEWRISYAYVTSSGEDIVPTTVTSDEPTVVLKDLLPNTTYEISIVEADGFTVGGTASTSCQSGDAEDFTDYGCSDPELTLYVKEDNVDALETSSTTFTTEEHVAFELQVSYEATEEDKSVKTTYVVRDADGNPLHVYTADSFWSGTWTTVSRTGDLPKAIEAPGEYTLEIYFNNQFLVEADFTVTDATAE